MFDIAEIGFNAAAHAVLDPGRLGAVLARLSPQELDDLEDDLDFCRFSGVPSLRILAVLDRLDALDAGWRDIMNRKTGMAA